MNQTLSCRRHPGRDGVADGGIVPMGLVVKGAKIVVYIFPEVQEVPGYVGRDIGTSLSLIHDRPQGTRPITTVKRVEPLVVGQELQTRRYVSKGPNTAKKQFKVHFEANISTAVQRTMKNVAGQITLFYATDRIYKVCGNG